MNIVLDVNVALSLTNAVLAGFVVYYSVRRGAKYSSTYMRVRAALALYWCVLYMYVALAGMRLLPAVEPVAFGRMFVRPIFTLTLLIMVISSLRHRIPHGKQ